MKLKIVGSGGMFQFPNPFCKCSICREARIKRGRYERLGFSLDEIMEIRRAYRIKRIIVTHIDEYWGKSYAYYREFEKTLDNISFAYDGMEIGGGQFPPPVQHCVNSSE